jgi:pimeloyl-ACP methyl ester carboxylesterase
VTIGNSMGGWIASEMALHDTQQRIGGLVLINAVGIDTDGIAKIVDVRELPPAEAGRLAFHDPSLLPDPATLSEEQQATATGNQNALELYASEPYMHDPKLRRVSLPVLVLRGEEDGVAPTEYGRLYAEALPNARFHTIAKAGHLPHVEQPGLSADAIMAFIDDKSTQVTVG